MDERWCTAPAWQQAAAVRSGDISPRELVLGFFQRIERLDKRLNAYVAICAEHAERRAEELEAAIASGSRVGPLTGVPVALKDMFDFHPAMPNTFGCVPLAGFRPAAPAAQVERLESAGAIVLGKTNTAECGHQGVTDNRLFGPTRNPFDTRMNAGGSSGGSAAAVAAGLAGIATGTDVGGSVRIPAAFCGIVGFKPTFGRLPLVARPNAFALVNPFLQYGPLTRTVRDAALALQVLMAPSSSDPWSWGAGPGPLEQVCIEPAPSGRVAFAADFGAFPLVDPVRSVLTKAAGVFEDIGLTVEPVSTPVLDDQAELSATWRTLVAVANVERLDWFADQGIDLLASDELSPSYAELLAEGSRVSAVDYLRAGRVRTRVFDQLERVLCDHDFIVTATCAVEAIPNRADGLTSGPAVVEGTATDQLIGWSLAYPINFTGHPAVSIPAGRGPAGLPIGMQIIGRRGEDERLLELCAAVEVARGWADSYEHADATTA